MTIVTNSEIIIKNIKHRGLRRLYQSGDRSRINAHLLEKIELIMADLDAAESINHLRQPGYRLHELKGNLRGLYAIDLSANWRLVFRFRNGEAFDVNLLDYH